MAMAIDYNSYITNAIKGTNGAYQAKTGAMQRDAFKKGINVNSGTYNALQRDMALGAAANTAAAANDASFNWLKQAQAQANQDKAYQLKAEQTARENERYWNNFNYSKQRDNYSLDLQQSQIEAQLAKAQEELKALQGNGGQAAERVAQSRAKQARLWNVSNRMSDYL